VTRSTEPESCSVGVPGDSVIRDTSTKTVHLTQPVCTYVHYADRLYYFAYESEQRGEMWQRDRVYGQCEAGHRGMGIYLPIPRVGSRFGYSIHEPINDLPPLYLLYQQVFG
jgi:hypothetical protein